MAIPNNLTVLSLRLAPCSTANTASLLLSRLPGHSMAGVEWNNWPAQAGLALQRQRNNKQRLISYSDKYAGLHHLAARRRNNKLNNVAIPSCPIPATPWLHTYITHGAQRTPSTDQHLCCQVTSVCYLHLVYTPHCTFINFQHTVNYPVPD